MTEPTPPTTIDGDLASLATWFPVLDQPLEPSLLEELSAIAPTSIDIADCAEHARDWWPIAIGWAAGNTIPALPRCVVRPRSTAEVSAVMAFATELHLAVTPSGGRSGVCGGSIPLYGGIALDLTGLTGEIIVDEVSLTATVGAGTFGPDFEAALNATGPGYTCGHFPQSFALSTVGGWLACRGAGQYSNRYGKIEDLVLSLTAVLPDGTVFSTNAHGPRTATGPSLTQLLVGAEGTLGIITEATLKIFEKPKAEARRAMTFPTFAEGLEACRRILRRGATPAVLRLYDEIETKRSFDVVGNALVVLDEADPHLLAATMAIVDEECAGATPQSDDLVAHWLERRNDVSQLEPLWRNHVVVDTIEMAAPWGELQAVTDAMLEALRSTPGTLQASVHQSHAYSSGACCYFTFAGRPLPEDGDEPLAAEAAYYARVWERANAVLVAAPAAVSHHHGIGLHRASALVAAMGEAHGVLERVKDALDPLGICNPGKLGFVGGPK